MNKKKNAMYSAEKFLSLWFCAYTTYLLFKTRTIFPETFYLSLVFDYISLVTFHFSVFPFSSFTLKYKSWLLLRKDTVQVNLSAPGYFYQHYILSANTVDLLFALVVI